MTEDSEECSTKARTPDPVLLKQIGYSGSFYRQHSSLWNGTEQVALGHITDSKHPQATITRPDADLFSLYANSDTA